MIAVDCPSYHHHIKIKLNTARSLGNICFCLIHCIYISYILAGHHGPIAATSLARKLEMNSQNAFKVVIVEQTGQWTALFSSLSFTQLLDK